MKVKFELNTELSQFFETKCSFKLIFSLMDEHIIKELGLKWYGGNIIQNNKKIVVIFKCFYSAATKRGNFTSKKFFGLISVK